MTYARILGLALISVAGTSCIAGTAQDAIRCDVPELLTSTSQDFDTLICDGYEALRRGDYHAAIESFEASLVLVRAEGWPSFEGHARLAEAYWRAGDEETGRTVLERARVVYAIYAGILKCEENSDGTWKLLGPDLRSAAAWTSEAEYGRTFMCAIEPQKWWQGRSLATLGPEAALAAVYLEVAGLIGGIES